MHRQEILQTIELYQELWHTEAAATAPLDRSLEAEVLARFREFISATPGALERSTQNGHLTGSALVVSADLKQVLLTLHGKLGKWLQLGGHADGQPRLHEVAMREAEEESGLMQLKYLSYEGAMRGTPVAFPVPFDFDCHVIPARADEPEHTHFDVRYLIVADASEPLVISAESKDLRWFSLPAARAAAPEPSMHRQFAKLDWLRQLLTGSAEVLGYESSAARPLLPPFNLGM